MAWNFERTQTFECDSVAIQCQLVKMTADSANTVTICGAGDDASVIGVVFNVNKKAGQRVGVITEKGARVNGIASGAIAAGARVKCAADGRVAADTGTTGAFIALTAAAAAGEYIEMMRA